MRWLAGLKEEISARNQNIAAVNGMMHEVTASCIPSVLYAHTEDQQHGNFHPISYRNICANPAWARRLAKAHTGWKSALSARSWPSISLSPTAWRWRELDCANSSDALLMNIFCYRRTVSNPALSSMLGVSSGLIPQFGFRPRIPLRNGTADRTEIDLKLGDLMIEAKLTEGNFQSADLRLLARYRDIEEVFDMQDLITKDLGTNRDTVRNYQLVRGVLAAFATGGSFCVLCDARRPDLIDNWYSVIRAVKNYELRSRLKLLTWQELTVALPETLRKFLAAKYGIEGNR